MGFFSRTDSAAAEALRKIYGDQASEWTLEQKSAWTRFVTSLLFRDPDSIKTLIGRMRVDYFDTTQESEARYAQQRQPEHPATLKEFLLMHASQDYVDRGSFGILTNIIDLEQTGSAINSMNWNSLNFDKTCHSLLTSDNPVILTNGIGQKESFIIMPIGPHKAFLATNSKSTLDRITQDPSSLAISLNKAVVCYARKNVWATNDNSARFIQKYMGTLKSQSMMEKIALMSARFPHS